MAKRSGRGGIPAIRGFDYQATVILDRLFEHFDAHGADAAVRPEGEDDLVLRNADADGRVRLRFEQIKKPRENADLDAIQQPWTLADAARKLLRDAISHLSGNEHEQVWILGDAAAPELVDLVDAGASARTVCPASYWSAIHYLARERAVAHRRHPGPNHALFHDVFRKVTAGRSAGLHARLARSLAEAPSLDAMSDLAARPPEDMLERAEQLRFAGVSERARAAAEKIICFALPFGIADAEQAFPDEPVGAAIRELLDLGLLRALSDDRYEMHETIRAGLERLSASNTRRAAHAALAAFYVRIGDVAAEILHLTRADHVDEAQARARASFLRGEHWGSLAWFVTSNKLVTPEEVIGVMATHEKVEDAYLLDGILGALDGQVDGPTILDVLRKQPQRFLKDYQWAAALARAQLALHPDTLPDLVRFGLGAAVGSELGDVGLGVILDAARRANCIIGEEIFAIFGASSEDNKRVLLPFLLENGGREALKRALAFIADDEQDESKRRRRPWRDHDVALYTREQVVEFLAALPVVPTHLMLVRRSPLLGLPRR